MANEQKWTPGPWRVEQDTTLIWGACNPDDRTTWGMGYPIAECRITPAQWKAKRPDADEGEANAHLISAAPDMYEALKLAVDLVERDVIRVRPSEYEELIAALEAWNLALSKARGE